MNKRIVVTMTFMFFMLVSTAAFAQESEESHNDVSVSVGAAVPRGADRAYLNNAPMISLMYGYRFNRFFQAESGLQMAFGAANNQNVEESEFGSVVGGDHEFMIPFSGRFYVPLPFQRWKVSAGGGLAYLHYSETATSGASLCYTCTSRGGWGLQGFTTVRYYVGDNFFVGPTVQYISGTLNGDAVGNVPAIQTKDRWMNVLFGFGLRF
jgi:hypothetical protein